MTPGGNADEKRPLADTAQAEAALEPASKQAAGRASRLRPGAKRALVHALLCFSIASYCVYVRFCSPENFFGRCITAGSNDCTVDRYTAAELDAAQCPAQPPALNVGTDWNPLVDDAYAELAARRLSQAVQIRTESYDDMPLDPTDERWDKMNAFSHMLETEFPKIYHTLEHRAINTHGHLFEWKGKDEKLQPILLMAHADTVPVLQDTVKLWRYPPFEGTVTVNGTDDTPGTWIWGRGSSDCKNSLMGIMGAIERLVTEGYTPDRTVVISFGFDEEIGGVRGAAHLTAAMQERYGNDSFAFLIDEGFSGLSNDYGAYVLSMGMAEKGSVDVGIRVENPGGHSSVPPEHTGIGIMAKIISHLEDHPFLPTLDPRGPYLKYLNCMADHGPSFPSKLKKQVKNPHKWKKLAQELAASDRKLNSFLATTQAVDLIDGGVKINALPEYVTAVVNYRISFTSTVDETLNHLITTLSPLAHQLNYTISFFDPPSSDKSTKHISVYQRSPTAFEPAPITSGESSSFKLLAGTSKAAFGKDLVVAPTGMYANTDTRHMWGLTKNIYRFTPALVVENLNQHTVDERISLDGHLNTTRYYYKLLRNLEGWKD